METHFCPGKGKAACGTEPYVGVNLFHAVSRPGDLSRVPGDGEMAPGQRETQG